MAELSLAVSLILGLGGCAATGPIAMRPADYVVPGVPATQPSRLGRVYVLRGFGDVFSAGMDTITGKLQADGIIATVHRHDQWPEFARQIQLERELGNALPPLVLIGHSWGADDCIRISRELAQHDIRVDLLITVEAVTPPTVPSNVLRAWNIYKPGPTDFLPWWRGVQLHADRSGKTLLTQIDIPRDWPAVDHWWVGHTDVDNLPAVQERIVEMVMETCPPPPRDPNAVRQELITQEQFAKFADHATTRASAADRQDVPDAR
jgi:pimeloyl-ACP methyl ester carboxylesterase